MRIINKEHSDLINEMLEGFGIHFEKSIEAVSTKEIVTALFSKVDREGISNLLNYLDKHGYYTAPASTKFHGNYEGGLAEHSINVCAMLYRENKANNGCLENDSIIVCSLAHDLCKLDFYTAEIKNVKTYITDENKKELKGYQVKYERVGGVEVPFCWVPTEGYGVKDQMPLPHGSKSLYILQGFIKVSRSEAFLITWHMGPFANLTGDNYGFNTAVEYQPSVALMYVADFLASSLYEVKE